MAKRELYFKYLRNEQNEEIAYQYKGPVYGPSNTDTSFYEPNATRIANMYKSASSASKGVYDFEAGTKPRNIDDCSVPFGRKPGLTFEEVSQMETNVNSSLKAQAKKAVEEELDAQDRAKKNLKEAVSIANAIKTGETE